MTIRDRLDTVSALMRFRDALMMDAASWADARTLPANRHSIIKLRCFITLLTG
jgi:hypothetical protein